MNDYSFFEKHMPYCVERHGDQIVVKNRNYEPIFLGIMPDGLDVKAIMKSFACPEHDCFRENKDLYTSYLYNGTINVNDKSALDAYLKRLGELQVFMADLDPVKLYKESPENIRHILDLAKQLMDAAEDRFEDFLSQNYDYVLAHGDRHYEQVYFKDIPLTNDYKLSMNLINKRVDSFDIIGPFDLCQPPQN